MLCYSILRLNGPFLLAPRSKYRLNLISTCRVSGDGQEFEKALWSAAKIVSAEAILIMRAEYPLQSPPVVEEVVVEGAEGAEGMEGVEGAVEGIAAEGEKPAVPV